MNQPLAQSGKISVANKKTIHLLTPEWQKSVANRKTIRLCAAEWQYICSKQGDYSPPRRRAAKYQ
jgi:hypothetical protein